MSASNKVKSTNPMRNSHKENESRSPRWKIKNALQKEHHKIKELEQGEVISSGVIDSLTTRSACLEKQLADANHRKNELKQENIMLNEEIIYSQKVKQAQLRKHLLIITVIITASVILFISYSYYYQTEVGSITSSNNYKSQYVIQNLKGDTIDTFLSWRLVSGTVLHVGITNAQQYPEKVPLIKDVVLSEEDVKIDDSLLHKGPKGQVSTYYAGWAGALKHASKEKTQLYIPSNFEIIESIRGEGDITIILTDLKSGDGYTGYTKSIADESQNQILKSTITIYDVENLSDDQFETILRHEFGHALGLAHSTAPEDLMAPVITTFYPYISDCDIDTIVSLYDGKNNGQVVCEK